MREFPEIFYYIGLPILGLIVWLVKLEAKGTQNTEMIKNIHLQMEAHVEKDDQVHAKMTETLSEIREDVGEIKGLVRNRRI